MEPSSDKDACLENQSPPLKLRKLASSGSDRMQKLRAKKYENESAGILRNNTLPLLIYGKIDWNQGKEKQRDGLSTNVIKSYPTEDGGQGLLHIPE